ncbi:MAG TPA: SDR family oxidoreductase [Burkholderiales bacterium]|nr:SDR family oxidoreductase [Burkholderiales bacterium]
MRVLILGGDGMLGHRLLRQFAPRHETRVTLRQPLEAYRQFGMFDRHNAYGGVDVRDVSTVTRVSSDFAPDAIINATGMIPQREEAKNGVLSMEVNALFPHLLARVCRKLGAQLLHLSTDCVFSGNRGNYSEGDHPDPVDVYGLSKLIGEAEGRGVLTLRTSMIGPELHRKTGLVEWFLAQKKDKPVFGWRRAIFSGFTTAELARIIETLLTQHPQAAGLYHASSAAVSKFDLLCALERKIRLGIEIMPSDEPVCDRSLDSSRFRTAFGYAPPSWDAMLDELAADLRKTSA